MSAPRYLPDRARRELAILPRLLLMVIRQETALAVEDESDRAEIERLRAAMNAVCEEAFAGLTEAEADKIERQILRVTRAVIVGAHLEDQPNAKIVAAVWHVLAHLIEFEALVIHDGSPMAEVVRILEPAHAHVYESPAMARAAEKLGRQIFREMQRAGAFAGEPAMGGTEALADASL